MNYYCYKISSSSFLILIFHFYDAFKYLKNYEYVNDIFYIFCVPWLSFSISPSNSPLPKALPSLKVAAASSFELAHLQLEASTQHQLLVQLVPDHGGGGPANFQLVLVQLAEEGVADSC